MSKNWIWMGHAGHFCLGRECQFHLNTYVNGYIISTVGELWNEREVREILADVYDKEWFIKNKHLKGDNFDSAYFKRFGYADVGCDFKFETMVFKAKKGSNKCCPYEIMVNKIIDSNSYNTAEEAHVGHYKLCKKMDRKK